MPIPNVSITLRPVIEPDLPLFYEHQLDPDAMQMANFPFRDEAAFMAHWHKILRDETVTARTILFDGEIVGNIVSFMMEGEREVGYWLGKAFWGKGIATGALAAFLLDESTRPLYAHVARHNTASRRVLEKCGFVIVGEASFTEDDGTLVEEYILKLG